MTRIRPISDLRNRFTEISEECHATGEPTFVTRQGRADLVVMSQAAYDLLTARLALYEALDAAESDRAVGDAGVAHDQVMARLRARSQR